MPRGLSLAPRRPFPYLSCAMDQPLTRRPIIGVTLDSEPPGGYAKLPWYALARELL